MGSVVFEALGVLPLARRRTEARLRARRAANRERLEQQQVAERVARRSRLVVPHASVVAGPSVVAGDSARPVPIDAVEVVGPVAPAA